MEMCIVVNGKIIKSMVKGHIPGPMEKNMKGNLKMINKMGLEFAITLMGKSMKENGVMECNMEKVIQSFNIN